MHQVCLVMSHGASCFATLLVSHAALEESSACPGDEVNYVCTVGDTLRPAVIWLVSCHTSSPAEISCHSDPAHLWGLAVRQNQQSNFTPCGSDAALLFTLNFVQGESNLTIAIPRNTAITHLEISCEASCKYLHIQG